MKNTKKNNPTFKRIAAGALALTLVAGAAPINSIIPNGFVKPITASALTDGDFEYSVDGDTVTITRYTGSASTVEIPSTIDGKNVTSIGNSAFQNCSKLTTVTIPDGVTSIGDKAFYGCSSLTSVTIGKGVTSIGNSAFQNCSKLTTVTIPDGVTSIGDKAFYGCSSLTNVTIPEGVKSIGNGVFSYCSNITSINMPKNLTKAYNDFFDLIDKSNCESFGPDDIKIQGALRGDTDNLRAGELLKVELPKDFSGKYFICGDDTCYIYASSDTSVKGTTTEVIADTPYFAIKGSQSSATLKVYAIGDDGKIYAGEKNVTLSDNTNQSQATTNLREELKGLSVIMFKEESKTLGEILGTAGITHIVSCCDCSNVGVGDESGVLTSNGGTDKNAEFTADKVGESSISYSISTSGCTFHKTTDEIPGNKLTVNVVNKPELIKNTDNQLVFELDETNKDMKYEIGSKKGDVNLNNNTLTFENLDLDVEYTIVMRKENYKYVDGKIIIGGQGSFKATTISHQHEWTYSAENNVITATCMDGTAESTSCSEAEKPTLTLDISTCKKTYDGNVSSPAEIKNSANWNLVDNTLPTVYYKGIDKTEYEESDTPPKNAGTYEASITVGEATATALFTIEKATQKVTVPVKTFEYGASAFNPEFDNIKEEAKVEYYYNTTNSNENGTLWNDETSKNLNAGTYYVYAVISETANYEECVTDPIEFTVTPKIDFTSVTKADSDSKTDGILNADELTGPFNVGDSVTIKSTESLVFRDNENKIINNVNESTSNKEGVKEFIYEFKVPSDVNIITVSHEHNYEYHTSENKDMLYGTCNNEQYVEKDVLIAKIDAQDIIYGESYEVKVIDGKKEEFNKNDYILRYYNESNLNSIISKPEEHGNYIAEAGVKIGEIYYYFQKPFEIKQKDIKTCNVTVTGSYTYDGTEKTPVVTVKDGDKVLVKDTDYTFTAEETNVGNYTVTVSGMGNYTGSIGKEWNINAADMGEIKIENPNDSRVYDGDSIEFEASGYPEGSVVTRNYYRLEGNDEILLNEAPVNAGKYLLKVIVENVNYNQGTKNYQFEITKKDVTITPVSKEVVYGTAKDGELGLTYTAEGYIEDEASLFDNVSLVLTAGGYDEAQGAVNADGYEIRVNEDYTSENGYENYNIKVANEKAYVTVTPILFTDSRINVKLNENYGNGFVYNGERQLIKTYITVEYPENVWETNPAVDIDYRIIGNVEKIDSGTYYAQIDALNFTANYDGRAIVEWHIDAEQFADSAYTVQNVTYGNTLDYEFATTDFNVDGVSVAYEFYQNGTKLEEVPVNVGTYTVKAIVSAMNYETKEYESSFKINPKAIEVKSSNMHITYGDEDPTVIDYVYDETGLIGDDTISFNNTLAIEAYNGGMRPVDSNGYEFTGTVESLNPNYTATFSNEGKLYVDRKQLDQEIVKLGKKEFMLDPKTDSAEIELNAEFKGETLVEGRDFRLYDDVEAFKVGKYEVEVVGDGNYEGSVLLDWYVTNIQKYEVTVTNGENLSPSSTGTYETGELVKVKADKPEEGYVFAYWQKNGIKISYTPSFIFKVGEMDVNLEAVYVEKEEQVEYSGIAVIQSVTPDVENGKIKIVSDMSVLENYKIVSAGIVATSNVAQAKTLSLENAEIKRVKTGITALNYNYTWTKTAVTADQNWYVKSYVTYKDGNGEEVIVYSDMIKANLDGYEIVEKIEGIAVVENVTPMEAERKIRFVSSMGVIEGCKINKAGIVATNDSEKAKMLTLANADIVKVKEGITTRDYNYIWTKSNVSENETWYVRPYVSYTDSEGVERFVYGSVANGKINAVD